MFDEFCNIFSVEKIIELNDGIKKFYLPKTHLKEAVKFLKNVSEFDFDMLLSITAVDFDTSFELAYNLYSTGQKINIILATSLSSQNLVIETISDIFSSANWDEREIFDLFGIEFSGHPNLKRLLMPIDWKGYPLRKDYKLDDERLAWNK